MPNTPPRVLRCLAGSILLALATICVLVPAGAGAQTPASTPTPTPTPMPFPFFTIEAESQIARLSLQVWFGATVLFFIGLIVFAIVQYRRMPTSQLTGDKDLEAARIYYGFWLIIGSLILTLAVVVVTVNAFKPTQVTTADILAIVSSVSGIIGTLIAAFFGIQAAGAGRSQALTALQALQSPDSALRTAYKIDPGYGPHAGNTRVAISGNGFTGAAAVNFGASPGLNFQLVNDGLIRVTTPERDLKSPSDADVVVVFPTATVRNVPVGTFYYYTLEPAATGPISGGTTVTIRGTGLTGAIGVNFGDKPAAGFTKESDGSLRATSPRVDAAGTVPIVVVFEPPTATNTCEVGSFTYV